MKKQTTKSTTKKTTNKVKQTKATFDTKMTTSVPLSDLLEPTEKEKQNLKSHILAEKEELKKEKEKMDKHIKEIVTLKVNDLVKDIF